MIFIVIRHYYGFTYFGPSYYTQSIANKTIVNELIKTYPNLEVRDIFQLYPDYKIDVSAEQEALLRHDTIILQYQCSGLICRQF